MQCQSAAFTHAKVLFNAFIRVNCLCFSISFPSVSARQLLYCWKAFFRVQMSLALFQLLSTVSSVQVSEKSLCPKVYVTWQWLQPLPLRWGWHDWSMGCAKVSGWQSTVSCATHSKNQLIKLIDSFQCVMEWKLWFIVGFASGIAALKHVWNVCQACSVSASKQRCQQQSVDIKFHKHWKNISMNRVKWK